MIQIYDSIIADIETMTFSHKALEIKKPWRESEEEQIIFKDDLAFELGGENLPGLASTLVSTSSLDDKDGIFLIGKDIPQIKDNVPYARIVLLKVDKEKMGKGNQLYQSIRKLDYTRYHVNPEGFMMRISSMNQKESVRISKDAMKNKIDFASVGATFIQAYHKMDCVLSAKIFFITDPDFDYSSLRPLLTKAEDITKALDHLLSHVTMDCHSCSLQKVCDEVEKMVDNDFKK